MDNDHGSSALAPELLNRVEYEVRQGAFVLRSTAALASQWVWCYPILCKRQRDPLQDDA